MRLIFAHMVGSLFQPSQTAAMFGFRADQNYAEVTPLLRKEQVVLFPDWLKDFQEYKLLELPIIPGSHNSATARQPKNASWIERLCFPWARQQSFSVFDQLSMGVRAIDFRLHPVSGLFDDEIRISHSFDTDYTLERGLREIREFLQSHPTEFVIIFLRIDYKFRFVDVNSDETKRVRRRVAKIMEDSEIVFANVAENFTGNDAIHISQVKVSNLAGKVLLYTHIGDANHVSLLEAGTDYPPRVEFDSFRAVDIWRNKFVNSPYGAKYTLRKHMEESTISALPLSHLRGIAIDITTLLIPAFTSPRLNNWFLNQLESNPTWKSRFQANPLGVLQIDFVNPAIMGRIMKLILAKSKKDAST